MSTLKETKKLINSSINKMTYKQVLTFGYLVSKRLYNNYLVFYEYEEFGKPELLYHALDVIRREIIGLQKIEDVENLKDKIWNDEEVAPDTEDFPGNMLASLAIDAVSATYQCLKYIELKDSKIVETISHIAFESTSMFITVSESINQNLERDYYYSLIFKNELMQNEINTQKLLIDNILNTKQIDKRSLIKLKPDDSKLGEYATDLLFEQTV